MLNHRRVQIAAALGILAMAAIGILVSRSAAEKTAARSALAVSSTSVLWMDGKSTIHDWESRTNTVLVTLTRDADAREPASAAAIEALLRSNSVRGVDVAVPVLTLKSGKDALDKNLRKAMKVTEYPNVAFHLGNCTVAQPTADTLVIRAEGVLTVTGKQRPLVLHAKAWRGKEGMWLEGKAPLLMSDYDIHPPRMLLGTLWVADQIVIHYRLLLAADAPAMGALIGRTP